MPSATGRRLAPIPSRVAKSLSDAGCRSRTLRARRRPTDPQRRRIGAGRRASSRALVVRSQRLSRSGALVGRPRQPARRLGPVRRVPRSHADGVARRGLRRVRRRHAGRAGQRRAGDVLAGSLTRARFGIHRKLELAPTARECRTAAVWGVGGSSRCRFATGSASIASWSLLPQRNRARWRTSRGRDQLGLGCRRECWCM